MCDVSVELRNLFEQTRQVIGSEKKLAHESLLLIGRLDRANAAVNLGIPREEFPGRLGLTADQFSKRLQAARVVQRFPEFLTMLEKAETHIAHLALVAAKITDANRNVIAGEIPGKSKRDVELFLSRITPDGELEEAEETVEIRVTLTKSELALLDRAKEVLSAAGQVPNLSKVLVKALDALLEAKDPVRRAERAAKRPSRAAEKSDVDIAPGQADEKSDVDIAPGQTATGKTTGCRIKIPAAVRHAVMPRDQGQCTASFADGRRCPEKAMLEIDHIHMVCRGAGNEIDNLTLKCRSHNQAAAEHLLGKAFMTKKIRERSRGSRARA